VNGPCLNHWMTQKTDSLSWQPVVDPEQPFEVMVAAAEMEVKNHSLKCS